MARNRRRKLPEPVTVDIESLSHDGRGVTHIDGKVAFVEGALAGEQVVMKYLILQIRMMAITVRIVIVKQKKFLITLKK